MRNRRLGLLIALAALVLEPTSVSARADYRDATPAPESVVFGSPRYVLVTFTEAVKTISLVVKGPGGADVTNGPPIINPTDPTNVSVQIHAAGDGRYQVEWDVVSGYDLDSSSGRYGFWVGLPPTLAPAPAVRSQPAPQTAVSQPAAPSASPTPATPPARPDVARDGRSLAGEPPSTQAAFQALWGDRAAVEWAAEHNAQLGPGGP
jgi:methionine-rich copper-binding protein CopC